MPRATSDKSPAPTQPGTAVSQVMAGSSLGRQPERMFGLRSSGLMDAPPPPSSAAQTPNNIHYIYATKKKAMVLDFQVERWLVGPGTTRNDEREQDEDGPPPCRYKT